MRSLIHPRRRLARPSDADIALTRLSTQPGDDGIARRRFLQGALATGGAVGMMPGIFDSIAAAATPLAPSDRVLVTVFLNGGNDNLNTLVPANDPAYHAARGNMAVAVSGADDVGNGLFLHPNMSRLKTRFDAGQVAFIEGVGEEGDEHSHFQSTAQYFAGGVDLGADPTGWLGRYADGAGLGELGMIHIGWGGIPMLLKGHQAGAIGLPPHGSLIGADRSDAWQRYAVEAIAEFGGGGVGGRWGDELGASFRSAVDTAAQIQPAYVDDLPEEGLPRELALAAEVVNLNLGTRIVSVNLGGFDHHDGQRPDHDELLAYLDAGIDAFFSNLAPAFAGRTGMLVFTEFGRRVEANNSGGTDHGTAGLAMFISPQAAGGHHGQQPSLTDLDWRGDVHHHVDFRSVYATLLDGWLDGDSAEVLGGNFEQMDFIGGGGSASLFFDVPEDQYYTAAVSWLAAAEITTGTGPGQFSPDDFVTRGQMATFLHRYAGEPGGSPAAGFSDVPAGRYYSAAVDWLKDQEITTGVGGNRFAPDDVVTRGQMATFLFRLEGEPGGSPAAGFSDVPAGAFYAKAVDWLLYRGITTGVGGNRFAPNDPVTRAQMATFLWRLAGSPV
ncbi:MAG: S-layer homology domain-containing protein [Actinomycetota bacterium]